MDFRAAKWFYNAANQNYPYGQGLLGGAFMMGAGVGKDPIEAYKWLSLTMTNEHNLGKVTVEWMQTRGMTFTPEQISAGKLRAEEYSKTNHISPKTVVEIPGL
jgi:TPR repeat protein